MSPFLRETFSLGLPDFTLCFRLLLLMCFVSNLFHHPPLSAPEGPSADPGRRQGKGLKKNVLGTRSRRCNRKACQITAPQSYKCMETEEKASMGFGLKSPWTTDLLEQKQYNRQVNVQSKAVFSCAVTLMDKIRAWRMKKVW